MYRGRHLRPWRVCTRLARSIPALISGAALAAASGLSLGLHGAEHPPSTAAATRWTGTFDANPVMMPLAQPTGASPGGSSLPVRVALLLPATSFQDRSFTVQRRSVPATARSAYDHATTVVAGLGCRLPPALLAAIGGVVSDHGRITRHALLDGSAGYLMADTDNGRYDGSVRFDGPVGPMGLLPWTFVRVRATPLADPAALQDAALAAARFLCATGADLRSAAAQRGALRAYDADPAFSSAVLLTEKTLITRDEHLSRD